MGINSVDMTRALSSETYAMQVIRNKAASPSERGQIIAHWGAEKVNKWESVDSTAYEITDDETETAKDKGYDNAKKGTNGFDGKADNASSITTSAVNIVGGLGGGVLGVLTAISSVASTKWVPDPKFAAATGAVLLANSIYLQTAKPNKEPANACEDMMEVLEESQNDLTDKNSEMEEETNDIVKMSEDAEQKNKEANEKIEDNKTIIDFYQKQYDALMAKAEAAKNGGEPLTPEEKAVLTKIAPLMTQLSGEIGETNESTSDEVEDLYSKIEGKQETYDDTAETMAEVQGTTEFAASFDTDTKHNANLVKDTALLGTIGAAGVVATGVKALGYAPLWDKIFAGIAIAEGISSGIILRNVMKDQNQYANTAEVEIQYRGQTEELNAEINENYETNLDTFAGSLETVEDLEIEMPEELAVVDEAAAAAAVAPTTEPATAASETSGVVTAEAPPEGEEDESQKPLNEQSSYTSAMGKGSDWTEVGNGAIKRGNDDKIVTDENGKVVLTSQYASAITSNGIKEGEKFGDKIPKVLETLLGSPFSEDLIKRIRNGESLTEDEAKKFVGKNEAAFKVQTDTTVGDFNTGSKDVKYVDTANRVVKRVIDFYYPIFEKASNSGWVRG